MILKNLAPHLAEGSLAGAALDALPASIAVLDERGRIAVVNQAWRRFGELNGGTDRSGSGVDYLAICDRAWREDAVEEASRVAAGIRGLLGGEEDRFALDYPCHSPTEQRWFRVLGTRVAHGGGWYVMLVHEETTARRVAEEGLRASERTLRHVLESLPVGVWIMNAEGRIVHGNPAGVRIWGGARYVGPERFGEYKGWWLRSGEPIAAEEWAAARAIRRGETSIDEEVAIECFDGTRKVILNSALPLRDAAGAIVGAVIVNQDVTDRERSGASLRASEEKWRTLFSILPVGVAVLAAQDEMVESNPALRAIFGLAGEATEPPSWHYVDCDGRRFPPSELPERLAARDPEATQQVEVGIVRADGSRVCGLVDAAPLPGQSGASVMVVSDISHRVEARQELERARDELARINGELQRALARQETLARTDFLTGLASRRHFYEVAGQELMVASRYRQPLALLLLDLDHFKAVNDRFGHQVGDAVLCAAARVASSALREADLLARHGGEELVALLPHTEAAQAQVVAEHLRRAIAAEGVAAGEAVARVTVSIGVAQARGGETIDQLVARADRALYAAKAAGRDRVVVADGR